MKHVTFIPYNLCELKIREAEDGEESRVVEGRAVVFGQRSVNLTPWSESRVVYEVLEPGCISPDMLARQDVVYNLNHNSDVLNVLGRYRNSERDTLSLDLRPDGLYTRCGFPRTNAANDTLELIRREDVSGQSFAFSDDWQDSENGVSLERTTETVDGKEVWIRHVKRITAIYDVSIVTHPAYVQTSVATREASDAIEHAIEEQLKREAAAAAAEKDQAAADTTASAQTDGTTDEMREREEREAEEMRRLDETEELEREARATRSRCLIGRARLVTEEVLESLYF